MVNAQEWPNIVSNKKEKNDEEKTKTHTHTEILSHIREKEKEKIEQKQKKPDLFDTFEIEREPIRLADLLRHIQQMYRPCADFYSQIKQQDKTYRRDIHFVSNIKSLNEWKWTLWQKACQVWWYHMYI